MNCEAGSRLMCLLCREYGRHQRHHFSLLEVEAAALRERVREALSDFRNFIIDLNAWNTRVTQYAILQTRHGFLPLPFAIKMNKIHLIISQKLELIIYLFGLSFFDQKGSVFTVEYLLFQ